LILKYSKIPFDVTGTEKKFVKPNKTCARLQRCCSMPASNTLGLVWLGWGKIFLRKKTMCLVAIVLKLGSRDGAICNQIYEKVVCMKQLLTLQPNM